MTNREGPEKHARVCREQVVLRSRKFLDKTGEPEFYLIPEVVVLFEKMELSFPAVHHEDPGKEPKGK